MSEQQTGGNDFEQRLLDRLRAVVAERGAAPSGSEATVPVSARTSRRRPPRLVLAAAAALAVAAVVLVVNSGGDNTSKAFAVEPQEGGGVTIEIYSLEDAAGLERALEQAGIPAQVNWLPAGSTCRERRLTSSTVKTSLGGRTGGFDVAGPAPALTIGVMSARQYRERWRAYRRSDLSAEESRESIPNVSLDPGSFRPDQSVVISGSPNPFDGDPEGGYQAQFRVVKGPVEPCKPVAAPASSIGAIEIPQGAASDVPAEALPAAGQFLYAKTKVVELQGWEPDGPGAGSRAKPRHFTANLLGPEGDALPALVPTEKEVWTASDGKTRVREALGRVQFLSSADQERWRDAGSPPPFAYDPDEHAVRPDGSGHLVKEYASRSWRGRHVFANVPKLFRLPTEPEALRLAIERRPPGGSPSPASSRRGSVTAERLMEILSEPVTSPALRAAAFGALAELPGIGHERGVADVAGRRGDALTWVRERGFGRELIFDRRTSRVLAQAEMIFGPPSTAEYGVPAGTVFRETAYLQSGIVGSTSETAAGARNGGPG
ncbi:MAG TPA: hypothetical protein VG898_06995 [Solirubrobacterales bacterium]|nr:hypothetical protein [Solirubrobacterales bacterium]